MRRDAEEKRRHRLHTNRVRVLSLERREGGCDLVALGERHETRVALRQVRRRLVAPATAEHEPHRGEHVRRDELTHSRLDVRN